MSPFLGPGWVDALDAALQSVPTLTGADGEVDLTVEYVVPDAPGGAQRYFLIARDGRLWASSAALGSPDVRITCAYEIAQAMHTGACNAQEALVRGGMKVGGAVHRIGDLVALLTAAGPALRSAMAQTSA